MSDVAQATAAESDSLSAEETAFFESKGEKAEGLAPEVKSEPEAKPAEQQAEAKPGDEVKTEVDETEETVELENKGRFVRHGAFHKERVMRKQEQEARRAAEARLAQRDAEFARADERLRMLAEAVLPQHQQQQQEANTPPDPDQDPFGYMKWQGDQIEQLKGFLGENQRVTEQERQEQQLVQVCHSDVTRFVQQQPDFNEARRFLAEGRDRELQAFGISDPKERLAMMIGEERAIAARALNDRASPAQRLYELAKARGYAPKSEKSAVVEQIETIQRGQGAAKTLSAAGGSPSEVLTAEALANMSEEEFAAVVAKMPRSQQRAMMGG